jgi:transglutaminase-like putative cysteine protease
MHKPRTFFRIVSAISLCFYIWTFGGGVTIAQAAKDAPRRAQAKRAIKQGEKTPEHRFAKVTEDIQSALSDSEVDLAAKKQRIRARKAEIEALDTEIRKQFAETEKRLKKAKLPDKILKRHRDFVKHYEDNLNELKANLDSVEKAKDEKAALKAIEKARKHLKRVEAPKKHQPLDPNNLPFRTRKPTKKKPRLKKEEFERDFGKGKTAAGSQEPILVASLGDLTGLLTSGIIAATDPPAPEDLAETIEVQFTPDITAKAAELDHDPVKIYNWVRNNIEFVPTYGSIQGAQMTLETQQGNAFDTASLLIALLRVSGIHARYVLGTVEIPIEKVMNWGGGFTDPTAAADFFASGGIPTTVLRSGGTIVKAQMEHVWVEAYVDYIPSRGARHKQGEGDTWVPLDASFKQYTYTSPSIDIESAVPFDAQAFIDQAMATATINEAEGYVTGIDSLFVETTFQDYQTQVEDFITQNHPGATVADVLGMKEVLQEEHPYLLGTLPYRTAVWGGSYGDIPDNLRHKITFEVAEDSFDDAPLSLTKSLPDIGGKKITLSYAPATPEDELVIESYLPEPHPDGTPIEPEELPDSLPAYLINVIPELSIDGEVAATGAAVGLGTSEVFTMSFYDVSFPESPIMNKIDAGAHLAIGLNVGRISTDQMLTVKTRLEGTKAKLDAQDYIGLTKEDLLSDLLYAAAIMYHSELGVRNFIAARTIGVATATLPSETIFASKLDVDILWGTPHIISPKGLAMDVDRLLHAVKALDGNDDRATEFMLGSGLASSVLEHGVPEQLFSSPDVPAEGISAVKALRIASDQGIPIYRLNQSNIVTVLPQLEIDLLARTDIENAVNAGQIVIVSKTDISFNDWNGCGYIIIDPHTGTGAYMVSGGIAGAWLIMALVMVTLIVWGMSLMLATFVLAAPAVLGILGGILTGFAIGLPISQLLSQDAKEVGKYYFEKALKGIIPLLSTLGFPVAFVTAVIALVICKITEYQE